MKWGLGPLVAAGLLVAAAQPAAARAKPPIQPQAYRDQPPLAYVGEGRLFILDGKGHRPRPVRGANGACCAAWAPDAQHLAFKRGPELWIVRRDGSRPQRLTRSASTWEWSADGGAIAVVPAGSGPHGVAVYSVIKPGVHGTFLPDREVVDVAWAPVGRRLAVSVSSPPELVMLEVPGPYGEDCPALCPERPQPLTVTSGLPASGAVFLAGWSPDVDVLAVALATDPRDIRARAGDLMLVPGTGGAAQFVAHAFTDHASVTWGKSRERFLVVTPLSDQSSGLHLCRPSGVCELVTTTVSPPGPQPAWSGDGRFAFVRRNASGSGQLVIAQPDGPSPVEVSHASDGVSAPTWMPDTRHLLFARGGALWLVEPHAGEPVAIAEPVDEPRDGRAAFARAP